MKKGKLTINSDNVNKTKPKIILRPEQKRAVQQTKQVFKKHNKMLWNAKMRFGKTLTALQLIKEQYSKVLILTHRPVVDDFFKMGMPGYQYASKKSK